MLGKQRKITSAFLLLKFSEGRKRLITMIITMHKQATSEERGQLMTLLCRITGSLNPVTSRQMGGREVIVLDNKQLDDEAHVALSQQGAVQQLHRIVTPYQLVSRAFQPRDSSVLSGDSH